MSKVNEVESRGVAKKPIFGEGVENVCQMLLALEERTGVGEETQWVGPRSGEMLYHESNS